MAKIEIELLADISSALKQIEKFSKQSVDATKDVEKSFNKLNTSFLNVSSAINIAQAGFNAVRGAVGSLVGVFQDVINEAAGFEESVNKLRIALTLSGIEGEAAVNRFVDFASALQQTTRFGDDAILSASALIQSLGQLTESGLERATKAALDLSTSLGIDLQSAATLVGKAAVGEVGAFSRYGLSIQKAATDAGTLENVLTAIEGKFGGSSEAAVKTYSGAIDQLQNNFSDFRKSIGLGIIENEDLIRSLNSLSQGIADLVPTAIEFGKSIGEGLVSSFQFLKENASELAGALAGVATAIALFNFNSIIAAIGGLIISIKGATAATLSWVASLITLRGALIGTGIGAIAVVVGLFVNKLLEARERTSSFAEAIQLLFLEAKIAVLELANALPAFLGGGQLTEAINDAKSQLGEFNQEIKNTTSGLTDARDESRKLSKEFTKGPLGKEGLKLKVSLNRSEIEKERRELESQLKQIEGQFKNAGKTQIEIIESTRKEALAQIDRFEAAGIKSAVGYGDLRKAVEDDYNTKIIAETKKRNQEISSNFGSFIGKMAAGVEKLGKKDLPAAFAGLTANVVQGAKGAQAILSQGLGAIADAFLPGIGGAVASIVDVLAQGPDQVKALVREFAKALPDLIIAITESFPVLIEELITQLIPTLVERAPEIIEAMVRSVPQLFIAINRGFIIAAGKIVTAAGQFLIRLVAGAGRFISEILRGAQGFVGAILEGAKRFVSEIGKAAGGGIKKIGGGITKGIKKLNPFAEGGVVPSGFPNDTYPAALTSGEAVVPNNLVDKLEKFLNAPQRVTSSKDGIGSSVAQNLTIVLQVGEEELARTLVSLDRRGFRLAV